MRVGVLMNDHPPDIGGGFTFEHEIFDRLLERAQESSHRFIVLHAAAPPARERLPANVEFPLAMAQPLHRVVSAGRKLWLERSCKAMDIDVLWSIAPLHPVTDTPYITTSWDLQHRLQPMFPEVSAKGEWEAREQQHTVRLRRATRVIVGTEVHKTEIMNLYQVPAETFRILPHPTPRFALDPPASSDDVLARHGVPPRYLLYPAQLWPHKNHANLLLALKLLRNRDGLSLPLVLVGSDRGNSDHVRRMIRELELSSQVFALGFVPIPELVALYRNALAMPYMSLFGPDNLPPLEAMALGCPVIAAKVSGSQEQLGDAALLVDPVRPEAIAAAIKSVHDDSALRARLIAAGSTRARAFTGDHFVRGVFGILDELVPFIRCWRPER